MTATETPVKGSFRGLSDVPLVARQVGFEQLSFWLNPIGAALTIGFSLVFIVIFLSTSRHSTVNYLPVDLGQYYVPAFVAYGVMAACFNILAITMVNRRELGLLKRLRLSPLPTWMLLTAIFVNWMIIALIQVVLVLLLGRFGYAVHGPHDVGAFLADSDRGHVQLHGHGGGHQHRGAQRRRRGPDREPGVLHPRRALGALLPDQGRFGTGHVHGLLPDPAPHPGVGRHVQRHPGHVAVERPPGHCPLGRGGRLREPPALGLVAQARVSGGAIGTRRGCVGSSCQICVVTKCPECKRGDTVPRRSAAGCARRGR